ncbi:thioesterase [Salmonella enterica]
MNGNKSSKTINFAPHKNTDDIIQLFCFPYAGASASIFKSWQSFLPSHIEVVGIQYPGHGSRISEKPYSSSNDIVNEMLNNIFNFQKKPFALFGHSMGAMIAFDLAKRIVTSLKQKPIHLFISGLAPPQLRKINNFNKTRTNNELINLMEQLGGTHSEILSNKELMGLILPALRSDFQIADNWFVEDVFDLSIPLTILGGDADNEVPEESLTYWSAYTTKKTTIKIYSGDHFFINTNKYQILNDISTQLIP